MLFWVILAAYKNTLNKVEGNLKMKRFYRNKDGQWYGRLIRITNDKLEKSMLNFSRWAKRDVVPLSLKQHNQVANDISFSHNNVISSILILTGIYGFGNLRHWMSRKVCTFWIVKITDYVYVCVQLKQHIIILAG